MNSFFRVSIMICLLMLVFTLVANFVSGLGIFPNVANIGTSVGGISDALSRLTGLTDGNMNMIWLGVTGLSFLGAVALAAITRTMIPIGLHLFSLVFWTSWLRMSTIFSYGGYIPVEFIVIFTVGVMFVFIAAIIGLITGGG